MIYLLLTIPYIFIAIFLHPWFREQDNGSQFIVAPIAVTIWPLSLMSIGVICLGGYIWRLILIVHDAGEKFFKVKGSKDG